MSESEHSLHNMFDLEQNNDTYHTASPRTEYSGPRRELNYHEEFPYALDVEELETFKEDNRQYRKKFGLKEGSSDEYNFDSNSEGSYVTDSEEESIFRRVEHRYPKYKPGTEPIFQPGLTFELANEFRKACRFFRIMNGYVLLFPRNSPMAIKARCKAKGCDFFGLASYESDIRKLQVNNMNLEHSCQKVSKNPMASSSWLAQNFGVKKFRIQPDLKTRHFKDMISEELGLTITREHAKKAKKYSLQLLKGDPIVEFGRLPAYVEELKVAMPGSTIELDSMTTDDGVKRFWRIYVCFDAIKQGFKKGCRPLIGLDGCFIKTEYKGQLLVAVVRDGDNRMYPVAWAVVDRENNETWNWFVGLLKKDIGTDLGDGYTIISDQQKGLIKAIAMHLPRVEHRLCTRHLWANFNKRHKAHILRMYFWRAVKATLVEEMHMHLIAMKQVSVEAYEEMINKNPQQYSRAYMSNHAQCDVTDNNMSESWNAWIYFSREKYVYSMLEEIRVKTMTRLHQRREEILNWSHEVSSKARQLVAANLRQSAQERQEVVWNGSWGYKVSSSQNRFVVNIPARTCSCRIWSISEIPCTHACCVIQHRGEDVCSYISSWYTREQTMKAYEHMLSPMEGPNVWENAYRLEPLKPPPIPARITGRPKKKRRLEHHELRKVRGNKLSRQGRVIKCSICKCSGHNKRKCPQRNNEGEGSVTQS